MKLPGELSSRIKLRYTKRAQYLKRIGFHIGYTSFKGSSPAQKGAVTRLYRRAVAGGFAGFTEENRFILKKLTRSKLKEARKLVSPTQVTPSGIMIQIPAGVSRKQVLINFKQEKGKGKLVISTPGRREEYLKLDPRKLAKDPLKEIKDVLGKRKPKHVKIIINGFEIKATFDSDSQKARQIFFQYWEGLYEELTDDDVREEMLESTENYDLYDGPALRTKQVSQKFLLKLIY